MKNKKKVPSRREGRPSKYDSIDKTQIKKLILSGWDDAQISEFFGIAVSTLIRWKKKNKEFCLTLKDWKKEADLKVEKSLYQRAIGYDYDEVTYEKSKIGGLGIKLKKGEIESLKHCDTYKTKVVTKQVAPDVTAQIFWLKNRQPDQWRDRLEVGKPPEEQETQEKISEQLERIGELISKRKTSKG